MKKVINILFNDFTNDNRVLKESVSLIKNGFEVELIATKFDKSLACEEVYEGINVKRVSVGPFEFLPMNLIIFWIKVLIIYRKELIFHANDLYALPPAYFIKKFFNKDAKIVYDCHEHETEAGIYVGKPLLKFFAKVFEKMMIKSADSVLTVSPLVAQEYVEMYGIETPTLIMNCPRYVEYSGYNLFRDELGIGSEKIIFLFQGEYLKGRGIENLINIFGEIEEQNESLVLVLLVYGKDIDSLKELIKGKKNIYWHDKVSRQEYMKYVASSDWGILLMENICKNNDYSLPNKLFDYIMGGLPVVVSNLKGLSSIVNEYKVGYTINPENPKDVEALLLGINKQTENTFMDAINSTAKKFSWEEQEAKLINIYKSL